MAMHGEEHLVPCQGAVYPIPEWCWKCTYELGSSRLEAGLNVCNFHYGPF
jgi:hypothetical protein